MGSVMVPPSQLVSCELEVGSCCCCCAADQRRIAQAGACTLQAMPQEAQELKRILAPADVPDGALSPEQPAAAGEGHARQAGEMTADT